MSKRANIYITVQVDDDTNMNALAGAIFDFLAADPNNLFPKIETVENYDYQEEP
jgi:hypothetical protein